jgi:hypothetical protein
MEDSYLDSYWEDQYDVEPHWQDDFEVMNQNEADDYRDDLEDVLVE